MRFALLALPAIALAISSCSGLSDTTLKKCLATPGTYGPDVTTYRLSSIVKLMEAKGYDVSRSRLGGSTADIFANHSDKFSGETTSIRFEVKNVRLEPGDQVCGPDALLLARVEINGEILDQYNSQDFILGMLKASVGMHLAEEAH